MVLATGFLVMFIGGGARFATGLTLKPMVEDLGWVRGDIGLAVALYYVVTAVCGFYAGRLADRASLRLLLGGGLVIAGVGIGAMSLVSAPYHALLLFGVVFAIGSGAASTPPVGVMVTRAVPDRAGIANAIVIAGMSIGQLVMIAALAAVLVTIGWRSVFFWIGLAHLPLAMMFLFVNPDTVGSGAEAKRREAPREGLSIREAARTRQFWLLLVVFAICGLDDFFVTTHVVAFAQDRGLGTFVAGNLLAVMGLAALIGLIIAGVWGDRAGPVWPTAASFAARIVVFGLVAIDQSPLSIAIFVLVFGVTFMVTAPLTVLFIRDAFGMRHLGALNGLITMVHQIFGGIGAYVGAAIFDTTGSYDIALTGLCGLTVVALVLTFGLRRPSGAPITRR